MKEKARVAVLGLGDFGYHFACSLHQLGHEVLAIDSDQNKVQQILPDVTKAAVANVLDRPAMEELGVSSFDIVVVCLPERLETTVLLVHHLKQIQTLQIIVKVANAEQAARSTNESLDVDQLYVKVATVDEGPKLKRWTPAAMGRATPVHKRTSHIHIIVAEKEGR